MKRLRLAALMALFALGAPALADEPGPGGQRPPIPKDGHEVYVFYCQGCHMADGKGATGAGTFPSLAANPRLAVAAYPISVIRNGKGGMMGFGGMLTTEQTAQLVTWLRANFGNNYPEPVTAADVERIGK